MSITAEEPTQRLFFALWPPLSVRHRLADTAQDLGTRNGRPVAAANLHLTLAFLGAVDPLRRRCMERAADAVEGTPFTLALSRVGYWPRPQVLWLGSPATPPELQQLVANLAAALQVCGYRPEPRPYRDHLTLARKVSGPSRTQMVEPVVWPVDHFCLVESVTARHGPDYQVLKSWPLESKRSA